MKNLIKLLSEAEKREILKDLIENDDQLHKDQKTRILAEFDLKNNDSEAKIDIERLSNTF